MTSRSTREDHRNDSSEDRNDQIGWFRYIFETDRWEWSDEVYRLHGYSSMQLMADSGLDRQPLSEWVLAQCHHEDRETVQAKILNSRAYRVPLSSQHRIVDTLGQERDAILIADCLRDGSGTAIGLHGFYVENSISEAVTQQRITTEVEKIAKSREAIDQAKGMLMAIYGLPGDAAFRVLRGWSQTSNTKLHTLAEQLISDFTALGSRKDLPSRSVYQNAITTIRDRCQQSKAPS